MVRVGKGKDLNPTKQQSLHGFISVNGANTSTTSHPAWKSSVRKDAKIFKGRGLEKYHLVENDLLGIPRSIEDWEHRQTGEPRLGYQYNERDLEARAWAIYGGPEGLAKVRRQRDQSQDTTSSTQATASTQASSASSSLVPVFASHSGNYDGEDSGYDSGEEELPDIGESSGQIPIVAKLSMMRRVLQRAGKTWVWDMLNVTFDRIVRYTSKATSGDIRRQVLLAAQGAFVSGYPVRPRTGGSTAFRSSESVAKLRALLDGAGKTSNFTVPMDKRPDDDIIVDDTDIMAEGNILTDSRAPMSDWTKAFYSEIEVALVAVFEEHGSEGWEEARWMIYDQYVVCRLGQMYYHICKGIPEAAGDQYAWGDSAAFWLHQPE